MSRLFLSSCLALVAMSAVALAEDHDQTKPNNDPPMKTWKGYPVYGDVRGFVKLPDEPKSIEADPQISPYIYLNRCTGGCTITGAAEGQRDDARQNISFIATPGPHVVSEYEAWVNNQRVTGPAADAEWQQVVDCMKEVYSPYGVMVVDTKPVGVSYTMAVIAGTPSDIEYSDQALGVAPAGCSPQDNVISFSFANYHGNNARVNNICWTAAQETAHAFGLDHEYQFSDGTSACNDPMTYRMDCGGRKFFRNKAAQCGENAARTCACGGSQNSHVKIRSVFGDGMSTIPAPTCMITTPTSGSIQNGAVITTSSGSKRGVAKVELWLNGYKWTEKPGAAFGANGQVDPSMYPLVLPANVPDGKIEVLAKCYDDLGLEKDSQMVTVQKGTCSDATSCKCLEGQQFADGKCFWEAPAGELGAECTYPQFCKSEICTETNQGSYCSQDCIVGSTDGCPMSFECVQTAAATGQCLPVIESGCCSASTGGRQIWAQIGLGALVLGLIARRRRSKRA